MAEKRSYWMAKPRNKPANHTATSNPGHWVDHCLHAGMAVAIHPGPLSSPEKAEAWPGALVTGW